MTEVEKQIAEILHESGHRLLAGLSDRSQERIVRMWVARGLGLTEHEPNVLTMLVCHEFEEYADWPGIVKRLRELEEREPLK